MRKIKGAIFAKASGDSIRIRANENSREMLGLTDDDPTIPPELLREANAFYFKCPDPFCGNPDCANKKATKLNNVVAFPIFEDLDENEIDLSPVVEKWRDRGVELNIMTTVCKATHAAELTGSYAIVISHKAIKRLGQSLLDFPEAWLTATETETINLEQVLNEGLK